MRAKGACRNSDKTVYAGQNRGSLETAVTCLKTNK